MKREYYFHYGIQWYYCYGCIAPTITSCITITVSFIETKCTRKGQLRSERDNGFSGACFKVELPMGYSSGDVQ